MTREEAKRIVGLYPIIEAYANGETIEVFDEPTGEWKEYEKYSFACAPEHYRIKPKPKFRPFKNSSECLEEMVKHQPVGWVKSSINALYNILQIEDSCIITKCGISGYATAKNDFVFADGAPFGVKEED